MSDLSNKKNLRPARINIPSLNNIVARTEGQQLVGTASSTRALVGAMIIPIDLLIEASEQVRHDFHSDKAKEALQELADDIQSRGVLEPLIVRRSGANVPEEKQYEIIAGARRFRAAQLAGLKEVPVIVKDMDDREAKFTMLVENIQRLDLTDTDEKRFFLMLQSDYNLTNREIAKLINKSAMYVNRRLNDQVEELAKDSENGNNSNAPLQDQPVTPRIIRFNPSVFRKFNQALDTALVWVTQTTPDTRDIIRQNISEMEQKLAELKKLISLEED
ncbi:MAG: ParB/RepB/Spo0J family partition protein [Chloroflexi bacterium]|uniref:ParB/RepB/Spo0J family partition protein n=1 Tax=Candidatus Chlorohelix allophototropha TaxID=3003348 RepID=A0A8T7M4Q1_9CHLR|nr:ParB/RepB/Spo0J family partition protein [Chloroflexota bacterium]WJW70384.1 ParB/RepB/Spo0J family partition protein [Chloroflexota bacterium L227-S17]